MPYQQELYSLQQEFSHNYPLDRAMMLIAMDEDRNAPNNLLEQLDSIAKGIHLPYPNDLFDSIVRLNHYLFTELGFVGDNEEYFHPHNSLLHKVLERRKGLPILLSALYIEIAKRLGLSFEGIRFPAHFIVSPSRCVDEFKSKGVGTCTQGCSKDCGDKQIFVDPFNGGSIIQEAGLKEYLHKWNIQMPYSGCIRPATTQQIVLRMSNNLLEAHKKQGNLEGMLRNVNRMMLLSPQHTTLFRTRACVLSKMERFEEALDDLENYMLYNPNAEDVQECAHNCNMLRMVLKL